MRSILLVLCVILPLTAFGQNQTNPNQQQVWKTLQDTAPVHEILKACDRDVVADLLWDYIEQRLHPLVGTEDNWRIVNDMWQQSRYQARVQYHTLLVDIVQDSEGELAEVCNSAEQFTVQMIGAGA